MLFSSVYILINGQKIPWGTSFSEVKSILDTEHFLPSYDDRSNLRIKCEEAYGFPAIEFYAGSPAKDKPVMQVIYGLSPPSRTRKSTYPEFWSKKLEEQLGEPSDSSGYKKPLPYHSSGSVCYSASWHVDDIKIGLSVFGGPRESHAGISAASLFMDWENEIKAASPFLTDIEKLEDLIENYSRDIKDISIYTTNRYQKPFYLPDYTLSNPHKVLKNDLLRRSQRALYSSQLMDTPCVVKQNLKKSQIALWETNIESILLVSNYWDTVMIAPKETVGIKWFNLLPAKGSGGMDIYLDHMRIDDVHSSKVLTSVVRKIEEFTGNTITCHVSEDF